ncbi:MAG: MarR family transcriptional regulator [Nocardioides sp.]
MPALERHPVLNELMCFDLYAASRAMTNLYRPLLGQLGLTYPQYLVLVVLWDGDHRTVKDLGETLHLDHGTLTPLLRRMELNGLLTRRRSSNDERFVEVDLTTEGRALRDRADEVHCNVRDALGLDDDQVEVLQSALRRLSRHIVPDA